MDEPLRQDLNHAAAGLLYPSESDVPFAAFVWKATETDAVKQIGTAGKETEPVTETSLDDFFAELIAGEKGAKFKHLRRILEAQLTGLHVVRVGKIEVAVYLIGKTKTGDWAGLQTLSVET